MLILLMGACALVAFVAVLFDDVDAPPARVHRPSRWRALLRALRTLFS